MMNNGLARRSDYHSSGASSGDSINIHNGNGARKVRRKNGRTSTARRKSGRYLTALLGLLVFIVICFSIGYLMSTVIIMWNLPSDSSSSPNNPGNYFKMASKTDSSNINDLNSGSNGIRNVRNNNMVPSSSTNIVPPLPRDEEQKILDSYQNELNQFPISIGLDENENESNWETILHPGTEALKHLNGDSFKMKNHAKKRASVAEIAGLLSGKKNIGFDGNESNGKGNNSDEGFMRVPKFWDPEPFRIIADERERRSGGIVGNDQNDNFPKEGGVRRFLGNYGSRLMTPFEAKSIGSRIPSSGNIELETIFVAIASYRDWQCSSTVESAFARATHPERIRVAVVDQIHFGEDTSCSVPPNGTCEDNPNQVTCKYQSQIDYLTIDASLSVGPVFARHLGHRLYRGEFFAMQSDAHVIFVTGWDDEIVEQWHAANNEMAILSTYLSGIEDHIDVETGQRTSKSRPIMCNSDFEGQGENKHLRHGQQPEGVPFIHGTPTLNPFWAAGFSFGRGHFVVNVPYDQHLPWIFQGEEISLGLRAFSYGYDLYSPEKSVCYHYYGRHDVPMFWENVDTYRGSGGLGMNRLNAIIGMLPEHDLKRRDWIRIDEVKYGLGNARDVHKFFDVFGIHINQQRVEGHLCRFVGRPMQKEFIPFLRSNGMGLDYDKITYRFVDQWKDEK